MTGRTDLHDRTRQCSRCSLVRALLLPTTERAKGITWHRAFTRQFISREHPEPQIYDRMRQMWRDQTPSRVRLVDYSPSKRFLLLSPYKHAQHPVTSRECTSLRRADRTRRSRVQSYVRPLKNISLTSLTPPPLLKCANHQMYQLCAHVLAYFHKHSHRC
jgi:hypothetical protein